MYDGGVVHHRGVVGVVGRMLVLVARSLELDVVLLLVVAIL